ncbi:helix-turn-helix domain-containing protein [Methanotorris formicicus]|uniref:Transcriptional regulator, TrmB n=1 Tax=Methanotorris formicicus Mc-S-70 TaxID=647171 RepID=H1L0M2_9EURY|nr:helix-turn-helix domain-containing protein [Methanotorris formicicus]EHP84639.1 transcriptional regulator, TrmB [Methanotorris formicicus Mc-S-70]
MGKLILKTPCTTFTLENLMCCTFGLKVFDVMVYFEILKNGPSRINKIAEKLNRDRSTVQRAVQNLMNVGLVKRKQVNIKEGGYFYIYEALPFDEVKRIIKETVSQWCEGVKKWIDEIEVDDIINEELEN